MILSRQSIQRRLDDGDLAIDPLESEQLQPSTVDLRLGEEFVRFKQDNRAYIDPTEESYRTEHVDNDEYVIAPGEFVLAKTREYLEIPDDIRGRVHGRSSWGRIAVTPHQEAGYVDPSYRGNITLEVMNVGPMPIMLESGTRFCQIEFAQLDEPVEQGYDGKYQDDTEISKSQLNHD